jgi:hypothetical protein
MSDKPAPKPVREDVVTVKRTGRPDTLETLAEKREVTRRTKPDPKP